MKIKLRDTDMNASVHMSRYVLEQGCQQRVQLAWMQTGLLRAQLDWATVSDMSCHYDQDQ